MDGSTVARALVRLEEILKSVVLEEVQALAPVRDGKRLPHV
jgi:hypothetical protein